ncbi:TPR repeat protein [Inquilinus ginsengisoli]|uniref:tetratricopeptide repeat protein n=1 Tax=Inquilinus ginsengisoli TaxID=363840 RepID=UPI003D1A995B
MISALFFALGIEVSQNFERAAYWYRRAADQGVASAAYNLGVLFERGLGVPRDPEAAVARFRQAAEAGHAGALNALGIAFLSGSGVARSGGSVDLVPAGQHRRQSTRRL